MGRHTGETGIVLLFERITPDGLLLRDSFARAGCDCPAFVMEEDGFLPDGLRSVYGFFQGDFKSADGIPGKPVFFNEVVVPELWGIRAGDGEYGSLYYLHEEKGRIHYRKPASKLLVEAVDWYGRDGVVRLRDHYNRYGAIYARTMYNAKGTPIHKTWISPVGREIVVENYVTGDILLNDGELVKIFRTKMAFTLYFLERAGFGESRVFYNSLSVPFFISNRRRTKAKGDILVWQEQVGSEIPANMQMILNGEAVHTAGILVQRKSVYEKLLALGAGEDKIRRLGFIYRFKKENGHKSNALICTRTDQIEQCRELIEALPQMQFHIAALTEMSPTLLGLGKYENGNVYPNIREEALNGLFELCDYYLDINHWKEMGSAVEAAFLHNHLIVAFRETVHNRDYVANAHCYPKEDTKRMIFDLKSCMADAELLERHLTLQRREAMAEDAKAYRRLLIYRK